MGNCGASQRRVLGTAWIGWNSHSWFEEGLRKNHFPHVWVLPQGGVDNMTGHLNIFFSWKQEEWNSQAITGRNTEVAPGARAGGARCALWFAQCSCFRAQTWFPYHMLFSPQSWSQSGLVPCWCWRRPSSLRQSSSQPMAVWGCSVHSHLLCLSHWKLGLPSCSKTHS